MNAPVFICGAHKSGTSLMRSLLDSHPELFVIPFETHYFQNVKHWVNNPYRKQFPESISTEEIIDSFTAWIEHYDTVDNPLADASITGKLNTKTFRDHFSQQGAKTTHKDRISLYFKAIAHALHVEQKPGRFVEKSVENAEFAFAYQSMFPDAKFIHIIRNPYANLVSLRKFRMAGGKPYPLVHKMLQALTSSFYHLHHNQAFIANYCVVKYEDLVTDPGAEMRKIADFLDIEFDDSLLTPTLLGVNWKGNSTSGQDFTGISDAGLNKWKDDIFPAEAFFIKHSLSFVLQKYKYKQFIQKGSFWKPMQREPLNKYFANRLWKYYLLKFRS